MEKHNNIDRFELLELDLPGQSVSQSAPAPVQTAPAPVQTAPEPTKEVIPARVPGSWASPGISQAGAERAKADEVAATEAGFSVKPPVYQIGSLVNQTGVDNFRAARAEWEAMPLAHEVCGRLADQIRSEDRSDLVVPLSQLAMLDDGRLSRGQGALPLTRRALDGLVTHAVPVSGGMGYLKQCPPELRALNVNHWLQANAMRLDARATDKAVRNWERRGRRGDKPEIFVPRELKLRTRTNGTTGKREAFAVVGPRYEAHDIDQIASQIMRSDAIPADARAEITYDGYRARIDVLFHSDIEPERAVAGEIFRAGIMIKSADDGSGSIQTAAMVWRNLCLNLLIIDHATSEVSRRSHRGQGIAEAVEDGITRAMMKVWHFADKWSAATMENVLDKYGVSSPEDVFRGLVANKVVHVPGVAAPEMFARLMRAWQEEPGYQKTDIVNAVTRAAHAESWRRWTDVEEMETTGGRLLYQPVWNVEISDADRAALAF